MKKLHTDGILESLDYESLGTCEPCLMGKMTKTPFSGTMERATNLLEIIHTDVCGPMSVVAGRMYRYFLTFIDDLSRHGYIHLMKHKWNIWKVQRISEWSGKSSQLENKVSTIWSQRRIFVLRRWSSIKTMWNSFTNSCHLDHHSIMVCPNVITVLYWI